MPAPRRVPNDPRPVTVRDATPEDNASLLALEAACAMGRWRSWTIRHDPDFFALFRAAGVRGHVGVASDRLGRVIGAMTIVEQPIAAEDDQSMNCYVSGWEVHPAQRGRGVGDALAQWALRRVATIAGHDGRAWFFTAGSGAPLRRRVHRLAARATISSSIVLHAYCLPTSGRRSISKAAGLAVRPAVAQDIPEMADLWSAVASTRRFTPALDAAAIERWRLVTLGAAPACYWVARTEHGALAGFMALWDQCPLKQFRMESRFPWRRVVVLRCLAAAHVCVSPNDARAAHALLSSAAAAAAAAGYARILAVADATDALWRVYREWGGAGRRFTAYVVSGRRPGDDDLDRRPLHVEAGIA